MFHNLKERYQTRILEIAIAERCFLVSQPSVFLSVQNKLGRPTGRPEVINHR